MKKEKIMCKTTALIEFKKEGVTFLFRNPTWNDLNEDLTFEYKIPGIKENSKNDGYYYNSSFLPTKKVLTLSNTEINDKKVAGVELPINIVTYVQNLYEQLKNEETEKRLNQDIKYTLNDTSAYGIYNGISQFDIEKIVTFIKKEHNSDIFLFAEDVAKILNKDKELKKIAIESYQPNPERDWNIEYLAWFREAVSKKEAPGYGIIPNQIIKEKITKIILKEIEIENSIRQTEKNRIDVLVELAKQTGKKQLIDKWMENCNDRREECNTDLCCLYVMPDGSRKITRTHTW